jgi:hypothetical protein
MTAMATVQAKEAARRALKRLMQNLSEEHDAARLAQLFLAALCIPGRVQASFPSSARSSLEP